LLLKHEVGSSHHIFDFIFPSTLSQERVTVKKAPPRNQAKKSTPITFRTTILQNDKNAAGIEVPEEIIEKLGSGKRPLVRVTIKKHTYRSAVAVVSGKFMIGVSAENRLALRVAMK
jgi:hypothetical protein